LDSKTQARFPSMMISVPSLELLRQIDWPASHKSLNALVGGGRIYALRF
jgi:hypothetical protein